MFKLSNNMQDYNRYSRGYTEKIGKTAFVADVIKIIHNVIF